MASQYRVRLIKYVRFSLQPRRFETPLTSKFNVIFSVWRPLVDVVEDFPLAVCDSRSAKLEDLIDVAFLDRGFVRHNYMATYNPNFRFHYLSKMRKDEVCIFKVFDSKEAVAQSKLNCCGFAYMTFYADFSRSTPRYVRVQTCHTRRTSPREHRSQTTHHVRRLAFPLYHFVIVFLGKASTRWLAPSFDTM